MLHFCHLCPWCLSFLGPSSTFGLQWGKEVYELCWVPAFSPESPSVERGNGQQNIRAPFSFTLEPRQTLLIIIGPNVQLILGWTEVLAEAEVTFQFHWEYKMTFWNFNSWHSLSIFFFLLCHSFLWRPSHLFLQLETMFLVIRKDKISETPEVPTTYPFHVNKLAFLLIGL